MKEAYLRYYEKYSLRAVWRFLLDAFLVRSRAARLSLQNRQKDYLALAASRELLGLHLEFNRLLLESRKSWKSYDYGEGYFYQSCRAAGITGLRDTEARMRFMDLEARLAGKSVLEIGCNSGFLSLSLADCCREVVGFDVNPYLIEIASAVKKHFGKTNCEFLTSSFEELSLDRRFDAVLSFANHSTYDQMTKQSLAEYFGRCHELLEPGGLLVFESHPPAHEGAGLKDVVGLIRGLFEVSEQKVGKYGTYLDTDRTLIVASRAVDREGRRDAAAGDEPAIARGRAGKAESAVTA